jgi:hypothetical protein
LPPPEYPVSEVAETAASAGTRPASTSGRSSRMKALAWQPGLAMRLLARMASRWPGASSGMPKVQPGTVRWAVLASITQVAGLLSRLTASREAASGRHRKATSAALSRRARSALSLRLSASMRSTSTSLRLASTSWMRKPVVPSWPST